MSKSAKSVAQMKKPASYTSASRGVAAGVGAVDEDTFLTAFEQVSKIHIYSGREVSEHLSRIRDVLSGNVEDWEKRVESLKSLRALVLAGGADYDEFWPGLRSIEMSFRTCVTDLRSLVVREACITLSYLSSVLRLKADRFVESTLESLLSLIANSAKVMSTSGIVAARYVLRHTHSPRLLPILLNCSQSKSAVQRRHLFEFIGQVLGDWPTHCLEKQLAPLQESLRRGLGDADQEARAHSRRAFWHFAGHFRELADALLRQLEPKVRQALERDRPSGLQPAGAAVAARKPLPRSTSDHNSLGRPATLSARPRHPQYQQQQQQQQQATPAARGRPTSKVSQSTPASREASPASRHNYITYGSGAPRQPRGPKSQGTSREASPGRSGIPVPTGGSGLRRPSAGALPQARTSFRSRANSATGAQPAGLLPADQATQSALAEALQYKLARRRLDHDSGDEASETSSVCSDSSFKSFTSCYTGRRFVARISKNMADILAQLESREWSNRRDGLVSFTNYLGRDNGLNQLEIKKVCEIFTRLFGESNGRVTQFFLEALVEFVSRFHAELHDWLYILLVKLVMRLANETLTSQQARVQAALDRVHQCFPLHLQFANLMRCLIDQNQQPTPKVQVALLQYLLQIVAELPADAFQPTSELKIAMSRLTMLTREPKSADVRKYSQLLLVALSELNPAAYAAVLQAMSATIQQRASEVLRNHTNRTERRPSLPSAAAPPSRNGAHAPPTDTMSPEDVNSYIRQTTQDIQSLTLAGSDTCGFPATEYKVNGDRPRALGLSRTTAGAGTHHVSRIPCGMADRATAARDARNGDEDELCSEDAITEILKELSNHNQRARFGEVAGANSSSSSSSSWHEQRKQCMQRLVRMVRDCAVDNWDEHFKTVLLILLETLGDNESEIRCAALSVLQELIKAQSERFADYVELTVLKVLEAHGDADKCVCKAAEDCARCVPACLPGDACLRVLIPIVADADTIVVSLAAIKMQMRVVQEAEPQLVERLLNDLCPGLVRCCEHRESQIRKAAIFCLVQMYLKVGETLLLHLADMTNTKKRLLQLYICRAKGDAQAQA